MLVSVSPVSDLAGDGEEAARIAQVLRAERGQIIHERVGAKEYLEGIGIGGIERYIGEEEADFEELS